MLRTVQSLPQQGFRHWAPAPGVSPRRRQPATGPPGSYPDRTSTGKRRRAYEHEDPPWRYVTASPPFCWAHESPRLRRLALDRAQDNEKPAQDRLGRADQAKIGVAKRG